MAIFSGEQTRRRKYAPLLILLLLILAGYALRAHNLDAFSFWTDEGLTPERSGYPVAQILRNEIVIQGVVTRDTHPPLYYLIIHGTRALFGESDFAFRYPSVLFGVLLIPLLYQLGRRMSGLVVGTIVALLAAVNPLQVYYSQEARMYSLLVLLVTAMSYVLWRALQEEGRQTTGHGQPVRNRPPILRRLLPYVLLSGLAVYTHYTVVFLIAAQALFWVWILWRNGHKRVILAAAGLAVLVVLPLVPYTVPRLLAGAEANYYYVSPLTMLLDVVRFFNLGLTVNYGQSLIIALNALALALLVLGIWAARSWRKRLFLLAWLLAVVLGLMAGSILFKPMYQGVRHIIASSPAYLLLLAFGISRLFALRPPPSTQEADGRVPGRWVAVAGLAALALVISGSAFALYNLYFDPAYVKDDFRAMIRFIETRAGDHDVIVYNNAVLLPMHEHYRLRPDIAVDALPAYPHMATGEEPELHSLAAEYDRIWFITDPPADKRDEDSRIQGWLDAHLTEVSNRIFPARTTQARVIGYMTAANQRACAEVQDAVLNGMPALLGVAINDCRPLQGPALWVDLSWDGMRPEVNASLLFTLIGPDEEEHFRQATSLLPDEDVRWETNGSNWIGYDLNLPPGIAPGTYTLLMTAEGNDPLKLGEVDIASTATWPVSPEQLFGEDELAPVRARQPAVRWPNGLFLAAAVPWDDHVLPGNNLPLTLYWQTGAETIDFSDLRYRLEVVSPDGEVLRTQEERPGAPWLGRVVPGALIREVTSLYFRPETEPGRYRLRWTLLDGDSVVAGPVEHSQLVVRAWPMETEVPPAPNVIMADFSPAIRLQSFNPGMPAGGLMNLTLYWQAVAQPGDYLVFIHLVDEAGHIVSQIDAVPAGGTRPTTTWRTGEVITDIHNLPVPDDLAPGSYRLFVGLYNPDDGSRSSVSVADIPQNDNQLLLTTLELPGDVQ